MDRQRRIEIAAMFVANSVEEDAEQLVATIRARAPGITEDEMDLGWIRGLNRLSDRVHRRFDMQDTQPVPA